MKIPAPPAVVKTDYLARQSEEHFDDLAKEKVKNEKAHPLSQTVLVKFGFLKSELGYHVGQ